jgi:hypothetical protein
MAATAERLAELEAKVAALIALMRLNGWTILPELDE